MKTLVLTKCENLCGGGTWKDNRGNNMLCDGGFSRAVVLENKRKIKNIVVVFTKRKGGDHDYFTIQPGQHTTVEETRQGLLFDAYHYLGLRHAEGYRYLHFEATYND